jgi:hypothetical protein
MTLALLWSLLFAPMLGRYKVGIGRARLLGAMFMLSVVVLIPSFKLVSYGSTTALIGFLLIFETLLTALYVYVIPTLTSIFPVSVRNTGTAFCYNVGFSLSSLIPSALNYWNKSSISESCLIQGIVVASLMASLLVLYVFRDILSDTQS